MLVDLSSNNAHPIDYAAAKAGGVQAAFVKATQGLGYTNPFYAQDVAGFAAVGVPVLGYHFAMFTDPLAEAATQQVQDIDQVLGTDAARTLESLLEVMLNEHRSRLKR